MAAASHVRAIQNILKHDGLRIQNLKYKEFSFRPKNSLYSFLCSFVQMYEMLSEVVRSKENRIFFLSYSAPILWILKKYQRTFAQFKDLHFLLVLHASFEKICPPRSFNNSSPVQADRDERGGTSSKIKKAMALGFVAVFKKVLHRFNSAFTEMTTVWPKVSEAIFVEKSILESDNSGFRYLALSPHIVQNAYQVLDRSKIDIHSIYLPTVFRNEEGNNRNTTLKVAVFGYGNSTRLSEVAHHIAAATKVYNFEIRIIGMDDRGTQGFSFISKPSPGKALKREDMESLATDIDFFLILYEDNRYRLSCSASVFESLSYRKPIIHLSNECMNFFNSDDCPIGIKCADTLEVARVIIDLANNYSAGLSRRDLFLRNIELLRERLSIENNYKSLQKALTF